jgi:tRNA threonylcarbamoyladenosine biosynthesis protein TsaE
MIATVRKTKTAEETIACGIELAKQLVPPQLVLLQGELGAGKTTLVKGIAEGFGAAKRENVTSPTFTLVHEYRSPDLTLYHIDLYRIETLRELDTLAIDDLRDTRSILLIEWGEKFERFRQEADLVVALERTGDNERTITWSRTTH